MASSSFLTFLVIAVAALQKVADSKSSVQQEVIAVYNSSDKVNSSCVQGADYKYNIDDLPLNLPSNTLMKICSNLTLMKNISLSSLQKVTVVGHGYPVIKCSVGTEAGLIFTNMHNLELTGFTVDGCGVMTDVDSKPLKNIKASVIVQTSTNVTLENLNIVNGPGSGLAMFYNNGTVRVISSVFERNGRDNLTGGNGAYVETGPALSTDYMANGLVAEYEFTKCNFLYNTAATRKDSTIKGFSRFDKGGGLCMYILASEKLNITIANSEFVRNRAEHYGGGFFASFVGRSRNSTITVTGSQFIENRARYGGATYTGYMHAKFQNLSNNTVRVETPLNCSHLYSSVVFASNDAEFGGGSSIFSTKTSDDDSNAEITFDSCLWTLNTGQYGSAVTVLPNAWNLYSEGYLPSPRFINCTLQANMVVSKNIKTVGEYRQNLKGSGAFYCYGHSVLFEKMTSFLGNNGSAIYLGSCLGIFTVNSTTLFQDNTGYQGGAIYELSSVIYIHDNATLHFLGNRATDKGGAIYEHTFFMHIYDYSRTCFIDYIDNIKDPAQRNISVSFTFNNASNGGHSIYASSLRPCYNRFQFSAANLSFDIFDQVGNFTYYPHRSLEIATAINHSNLTDSSWQGHLAFVPGKETIIPFFDVDDLNQSTTTNYLVSISSDSYFKTNKHYSEISSNSLRLYGTAYSNATVTLSDTTSRQIALSFNVTMQPCPPGFIEDESLSCSCAFNTDSSYMGIESCDLTLMKAYQKRGYWVGYETNQSESEDTLLSGYCSPGFCSNSYRHNFLPGSANQSVLNAMMCSKSRRGILCGQCTENSSVHYHSLNFRCKADKYCSLGWLFYVLSVILPVTVIFLVIIIFNVPFTSGLVNGFIFYCQVVESLQISASGMIPISAAAEVVNKIHSIVYLTFSLNTFVLDELSFCLWKGTDALATVAFNYVTLVYALLLVILLTLLMKSCNTRQHFSRFSQYMPLLASHSSFQGNIIHGLSAFLILCYAQCAHSSVLLLTSAKVFKKGLAANRTVVYLNGEIEWMGPQHLTYAIPAIVLSLVIVILPPLLLLVYPLHYRVLAIFRIAESRFSQIAFSPLEKLKPFFDSFQGCFKDEYRFFAGLYFVYRFFIMFNLVINYLENSFFVLEIQLILMLILHSTCQPYKQRLHNLIDTWLIGNLAIINAITYYNFTTAASGADDSIISVTVWIQTVLIVLPMPIMLLCLMIKLRVIRKCSLVRKKNLALNKTENEDLPARLNSYGSCDMSPEFCH